MIGHDPDSHHDHYCFDIDLSQLSQQECFLHKVHLKIRNYSGCLKKHTLRIFRKDWTIFPKVFFKKVLLKKSYRPVNFLKTAYPKKIFFLLFPKTVSVSDLTLKFWVFSSENKKIYAPFIAFSLIKFEPKTSNLGHDQILL